MIVGAVVVVVVVEVVVVVVVEVAGAVKTDVKVFTRVEVRNVTWKISCMEYPSRATTSVCLLARLQDNGHITLPSNTSSVQHSPVLVRHSIGPMHIS